MSRGSVSKYKVGSRTKWMFRVDIGGERVFGRHAVQDLDIPVATDHRPLCGGGDLEGLHEDLSKAHSTTEEDDDLPWTETTTDVETAKVEAPRATEKPKRKRRTKAEMEAARAAEAEKPKVRRKRRTKAEIEAAKQREAATEQVEDDPLAALGI